MPITTARAASVRYRAINRDRRGAKGWVVVIGVCSSICGVDAITRHTPRYRIELWYAGVVPCGRLTSDAALITAVVQARLPIFVEFFDAHLEHFLHDLIVGKLILEGGDE